MPKRARLLWFLPFVLLLAGCASGSTGGPRTQTNVLTQDEIQSVNLSNLYEVVQRLRPRWLTVRSPQGFGVGSGVNEVVVFQDQTLLGGVDMLKEVEPDLARSLRYLDGPTASASLPGLGNRHVEGAIVIVTRSGS